MSQIVKYKYIIAIVVVLLFSFFLRLNNVSFWKSEPFSQMFYYQEKPLLTGWDGYYYARYAKELLNGEYKKIDNKRGAPEVAKRPFPPPLISVVGAGVAKILHTDIDKVAFYLPIVLGSLVVIPCFLWGRFLGSFWIGLLCALATVVSPRYFHRSQAGWFDTDILNVFFALFTFYLIGLSIVEKRDRGYIVAALGGICFYLFHWWWTPSYTFLIPGLIVALIIGLLFYSFYPTLLKIIIILSFTVSPVAALFASIAIVFIYLKKVPYKKYVILLFSLLSLEFVLFSTGFSESINTLLSRLGMYGLREAKFAGFPNVLLSISEEKQMSFFKMFYNALGSDVLSVLSVIGIIGLLVYRFKRLLFLLPFFILGLGTFHLGIRFTIFLVPFLGMGLGFLIYLILTKLHKSYIKYIVALCLTILFIIPSVKKDMHKLVSPSYSAPVAKGLSFLKEHSSKDACVFTWWDAGYFSEYWAERATFTDGGCQFGLKTYLTALSFSTDNPFLSAHIMRFMTEKGEKGVEIITKKFGIIKGMNLFKQVLSLPEDEADAFLEEKGLKDWKDFFFPKATRPVYVMFTGDLPRKMYWIYYFGSWDFQNKEGSHHAMIRFLCKGEEKLVCNNETAVEDGRIFYRRKYIPLERRIFLNLKERQIREEMFYKNSRFLFEGLKMPDGLTIGFLLEKPLLNTFLNRMFILHVYNRELFEPVYVSFPQVSIWKLKI